VSMFSIIALECYCIVLITFLNYTLNKLLPLTEKIISVTSGQVFVNHATSNYV